MNRRKFLGNIFSFLALIPFVSWEKEKIDNEMIINIDKAVPETDFTAIYAIDKDGVFNCSCCLEVIDVEGKKKYIEVYQ